MFNFYLQFKGKLFEVDKNRKGKIKLKTPLQKHMDDMWNKQEEGWQTTINTKDLQ